MMMMPAYMYCVLTDRYRFFSLRGSVLSYYDFKWVFQSIVPQHGLDERCMTLGPGSKILVDSAKKSAQPSQSQEDAKISNPEIAAALENGTTFTIAHPPVFLTFASPEKANGVCKPCTLDTVVCHPVLDFMPIPIPESTDQEDFLLIADCV